MVESYCDLTYYKDSYLLGRDAVIPEKLFQYYAYKATIVVKGMINQAYEGEVTDEMKGAMCEVAEILCKYEGKQITTDGDEVVPEGIASEHVGEYSVSYTANSAAEKLADMHKKIVSALTTWLGSTGLLYKGQGARF